MLAYSGALERLTSLRTMTLSWSRTPTRVCKNDQHLAPRPGKGCLLHAHSPRPPPRCLWLHHGLLRLRRFVCIVECRLGSRTAIHGWMPRKPPGRRPGGGGRRHPCAPHPHPRRLAICSLSLSLSFVLQKQFMVAAGRMQAPTRLTGPRPREPPSRHHAALCGWAGLRSLHSVCALWCICT